MTIEVKECEEENCIVEQAKAIIEFNLQSIFFYNATALQLDLLSNSITKKGSECLVTTPQKQEG